MKEYIERKVALEVCNEHYVECLRMQNWAGDSVAYDIADGIRNLPAADVVERKRGEWVRKEDECCYWFECSECGNEPAKLHSGYNYDFFSNFCPNCGADMRKTEANHAD